MYRPYFRARDRPTRPCALLRESSKNTGRAGRRLGGTAPIDDVEHRWGCSLATLNPLLSWKRHPSPESRPFAKKLISGIKKFHFTWCDTCPHNESCAQAKMKR